MDLKIPDKLYFKIGEVAELTGVKTHVLRYWESEFAAIRPGKRHGNQRLYRRRDIETIIRLKDLLYNQGFTIAGAKKKLKERLPSGPAQMDLPLPAARERRLLCEIRQDLCRLRDSLDPAHSMKS